jgi:uncharacterized membrane protein YhiD involved in acid resistance
MFDIDLMNFNPQAPSFMVMLITALFAFFLSSVIAVTYEYTTKSIYKKAHFLQAIILIGIVAATILQAIGESVAVGLGIIGALSIIRFRTTLNDPRNITFIFASLGVGIACGVKGFGIATTGTAVFCIGATLLRLSPLSNANELIGSLKLRIPKEDHFQAKIEQHLRKVCRDFELDRLRFLTARKNVVSPEGEVQIQEEEGIARENLQEFVYLVRLKDSTTVSTLEATIRSIDGLEDLRLDFQKQPTQL